ncbi:MAG: MMPL family transporter [Nitrosomonadales bacterium]|nr:MMPL family transporter [Nitrosomonadales bacterium]
MQVGADLNAFLPGTPTPAQRLLTEQLRDGMVSRLILIGIEGGKPESLAAASKQLAQRLRREPDFLMVNNGEEGTLAKDQAFLFDNRYLLSSAVTPERFGAEGLHGALENALQLLGSPAGVMVKRVIPRDPSGELLHLLEGFAGQSSPPTQEGVWMSRDGKRALLILQTAAAGYDIDAQQRAVERVRGHFAQATGGLRGLEIRLSGPGVFSVEARDNIESVAFNFSIITAIIVSLLLLLVYRSWQVLAISLLPVISGALAGIAAVSLGYGVVFGVTLGFGITLIGEAVDYAIYFFTHLAPGRAPDKALENIWPTIRLGVLTTICGFSPMFLADFPGLAQLGLFSVVGLIVAVLVTRWVLPNLITANFAPVAPTRFAGRIIALIAQAPRLRPLVLVAVAAAVISIALHREPVWSDQLSSLFPLSVEKQQLDQSLRDDLGAPDVRYLIVVGGKDREAVLERSEAVAAQLDALAGRNILTGYDTPSRYLPSQKTQHARQTALPDETQLRANLKQALAGLPFRDDLFEPFQQDIAAARSQPLLTQARLQGTNLGLQTESLLAHYGDGWKAMLPLRGVTEAQVIRQTFDQPDGSVILLDLKQESDELYQSYVHEAVTLSAVGALSIVVLLFISLRSARRVAAVLLPLAAAVVITLAILLAGGQKLLLFHLVGLLLSVAVGSNYSLFFDRESQSQKNGAGKQDDERGLTMVSLLVANLSTTIAFGMLGFSGVPVLTAIGQTVAIGAFLSLLFSAVLMGGKVAK